MDNLIYFQNSSSGCSTTNLFLLLLFFVFVFVFCFCFVLFFVLFFCFVFVFVFEVTMQGYHAVAAPCVRAPMSTDSLVWFSQNPSVGIHVDSHNRKQNSPPEEWYTTYAGKLKHFMVTCEYFFVQISVQVWLRAELKLDCCSDLWCKQCTHDTFQYKHFRCRVHAKNILKIKIPFQILFYPFRCMFKIMKGYKIVDFTPSGKSLKKTLIPTMSNPATKSW